jgi:peroxiredoxin
LTLTGLDDQPVTLADYKGKGIVVLYFWATWASPSTATMPELNAFVDEFSKLGIRFLAVNVGEQAADVKSFVAQAGYKGTVVRDPQAQAMAALKIPELPAVAIIAKDGTLHKTEIGTGPAIRDAVRKTLEALLKGNATKGQGVERKR